MTTPHGLSEGQLRCWVDIAVYIQETGLSPAVSDLMEMAGVRSRSLIQSRVDALKDSGIVSTHRNIPRSIRLLELPPRELYDDDALGERRSRASELADSASDHDDGGGPAAAAPDPDGRGASV